MNNKHKFILCTNNDVGESREKEIASKYGTVEDNTEAWELWKENYGIASSVTYPRLKSAICGFVHSKDFKNVLFQKKLTVASLKKIEKTWNFESVVVDIDLLSHRGCVKISSNPYNAYYCNDD